VRLSCGSCCDVSLVLHCFQTDADEIFVAYPAARRCVRKILKINEMRGQRVQAGYVKKEVMVGLGHEIIT